VSTVNLSMFVFIAPIMCVFIFSRLSLPWALNRVWIATQLVELISRTESHPVVERKRWRVKLMVAVLCGLTVHCVMNRSLISCLFIDSIELQFYIRLTAIICIRMSWEESLKSCFMNLILYVRLFLETINCIIPGLYLRVSSISWI